jgi:hypothetical protein
VELRKRCRYPVRNSFVERAGDVMTVYANTWDSPKPKKKRTPGNTTI